MLVNRKYFGKSVLGARAMLSINRIDLSSRARLGHETVARVERGDNGVSMNALAAIQRALEEAGVFFPHGTNIAAVALLDDFELPKWDVEVDPSMPSGTRRLRKAV